MSESELKVPKEKKKKKSGVKQSDVAEVAKKVKDSSSEQPSIKKPSLKKGSITETDKILQDSSATARKNSSAIDANTNQVQKDSTATDSPAARRSSTADSNTNAVPLEKSSNILSRAISESGKNDDRKVSFDNTLSTNELPSGSEDVEAHSRDENVRRESTSVDISQTPRLSNAGLTTNYTAPAAATKKDVELLKDLDEEKLIELKEAFELFDLNQDGIIDKHDLKNTLISLGQLDIADEEIYKMLSEASNPLDFDSFVILLGYKTIELDPEEVLLEALSKWDYGEQGLIAEERIKHDLQTWGDKFTPKEAEQALEDAPVCMKNHCAMIDYIQFCKMLCGLRKKTSQQQPQQY